MTAEREAPFGATLRRFRTAAGLTQEELAERAGMSQRAISDLERGARTKPWRTTVALLSEALKLPAADRARLEGAIVRSRNPAASPLIPPPVASLPPDVTPLIGREREEAAIAHLLRHEVRLLTLIGAGGVGKTRLALRVAATEAWAYAGGVRFVPLASLRSASHVVSALARAFRLEESPGQALDQTLRNALCRQELLLVLDNFEHLHDAAPFLAELLASCPRLSMLVTSREPLHLRGEQEFMVHPLESPPASQSSIAAADLSRFPASALFLDRARAVCPGMQVDDRAAAAIAAICRHLDGLPLAIELAAARLKYESPQHLLERVHRRFEVLVAGPRDLPMRQQTMRACLAWSYDLLSRDEQDGLCRLAVFAGGCTAEAAEYLLEDGEIAPARAERTIHSLVDKSLLVAERMDRDRTRFTMLETVREYALERLREQGTSEQAYSRYGRYYLALAMQAERAVWGPDEPVWGRRLGMDRDNLRSVLAWSLEHDVDLGLRIAGALRRYWTLDGHYSEWWTWVEQALASDTPPAPAVRAGGLLTAGWLALHDGNIATAMDRYREGLSIARDLGDLPLVAVGIIGFGLAELAKGDTAAGRALFGEAIDISRQMEAPHLRGPAFYGLGLALQVEGADECARERLEQAVQILEAHGERFTIGSALRALGEIGLVQGDNTGAQMRFRQGLQAAIVAQHREGIAIGLEGSAASMAALGQIERAARLWGAAEAIHEELHGHTIDGDAPLARLPGLSPHVRVLSPYMEDPRWPAAQADGYAAPLQDVIADALDGVD